MSEIDLNLLPEFVVEASEHLDELETLLLQLVENPTDLDVLNEIFRPVHTIKGSAQFIGVAGIAKLSHKLEDLLDILREGRKDCSGDMIAVLIETRDRIVKMVAELDTTQQEQSKIDDLIEKLESFISDDVSKIELPDDFDGESFLLEDEGEDEVGLVNEVDSDDELVEIFYKHQHEQLEKIKLISDDFDNHNDKIKLIDECYELVKSLFSPANYMDFEDLKTLYKDWMSEIEESKSELEKGEEIALFYMDIYFIDAKELLQNKNRSNTSEAGNEIEHDNDIDDDFDMPSFDDLDAAVNMSDENEEETVFVEDDLDQDSESLTDMALLPDFVVETSEHLDELEDLLLQLNDDPKNLDVLNEIFRPVHTIKGSAQFIGIVRVAKLSHKLEDLLDLLRQGKKDCTSEIIALLMLSRDRMRKLVSDLEREQHEQSDINDLIDKINFYINEVDENSNTITEETVAPVVTVDNHDKEYDEELYDIFTSHLSQQLKALKTNQHELNNAMDKQAVIADCIDILVNLKSSANYMEYTKLLDLYTSVIKEIETVKNQALNDNQISLDCLDDFYISISELFPDVLFDESNSISDGHENLNSSVMDDVISDSLVEDGLNDELYDNLSNALDDSKHKVSKVEYDTLNKVFDEIISSQKPDKDTAESNESVSKSKKNKTIQTKRRSVLADKINKSSKDSKVKRSLRVDSGKIDSLMNQVGELVVDRSYFQQLFVELGELQQQLKDNPNIDQKEIKSVRTFSYRFGEAISGLARTSNELQEEVMKMRMLPIAQIFNRYPRLIHDLTNNTDKKVNLIVRGEDTELDKMIVEEISDPLIHIIRNAVDHGLETIDERREGGKQDKGSLILEAYQESNHIVIEVTDDGKGIDHDRIKAKAFEKGLYSVDELDRMNVRELNQLILTPGFSTAEKITGTSGRGVGMDVVKQNIDKLNGILEIESKLGFGTRMRLKIPLTLAIIHALMVRVGKEMFTVPLANVDETVRIQEQDISTVEGVEVIYIRSQTMPIFRLSSLFSVASEESNKNLSVVIVSRNGQRTGFVVDELLGQEEVVIKPLAEYVQHKSGFSGATIIGDGRISLILDVYELVQMTELKQAKKQKKQVEALRSKVKLKNNESPQVLN